MKIIRTLILGGAVAFLGGCVTNPTITSDFVEGTNFSGYKTFAVMERVGMGTGITAGPTLTAKVRAAVTQSLTAKGFTSVDRANADLLVMVQGRLNPHLDVTYYGYDLPVGRPWRYGGEAGPFWSVPVDTEINVSNSGRLAVDIIDRKSRVLIWRGVARKDFVSDEPDPVRIAAVATMILDGFPPTALPRQGK